MDIVKQQIVEEKKHDPNIQNIDQDVDVVFEKNRKVGSAKFNMLSAAQPVQQPAQQQQQQIQNDDPDIFGEEEVQKGDEFMAVRPWVGAIKEPSNYAKNPNSGLAPAAELTLGHVFGYRAKDCRNNIKFIDQNRLVYHAAALGIVFDYKANQQTFFNKHTDDITSLDVNPKDLTIIATGDIGAKPNLFVWNANSLEVLQHFTAPLMKGIGCLSFTPSGLRLVGVDVNMDTKNEGFAIFDISTPKKGVLLAKCNRGTDRITEVVCKDENTIGSCGAKHFGVWSYDEGKKMINSKKSSIQSKVFNSISIFNDGFICSSTDGNLYHGDNMKEEFKLNHGRGIDCISSADQGKVLLVGGRVGQRQGENDKDSGKYEDRIVYALNQQMQVLTVIKEDILKLQGNEPICPNVRAINLSPDRKNIVIGTYGSEIYVISSEQELAQDAQFNKSENVMRGHYTPNQKWTNEIWGLHTFQKDNDKIATCSDDGTLRIWSVSQKKQIAQVQTQFDLKGNKIQINAKTGDLSDNCKARCIGISSDDSILITGHVDGTLRCYLPENGNTTFKLVNIIKDATKCISDIKFSPDNKFMAVGSHDQKIYYYELQSLNELKFVKKGELAKHNSYITHLDFSQDGQHLQSNCGAYELLFWDLKTNKQMPGGATQLRDEQWYSQTCVLGWPVQGIWAECADGTDVNSLEISHNQNNRLIVTGDDFYKVKLFNYPCIQQKAKYVQGVGHSSHVTNVRWSNDDSHIFSIGGEDNCVFIWNVKI